MEESVSATLVRLKYTDSTVRSVLMDRFWAGGFAAMRRHYDDDLRPFILRYAHPCVLLSKIDEPARMVLAGGGDCS